MLALFQPSPSHLVPDLVLPGEIGARNAADERPFRPTFLSTVAAGPGQRRLALAVLVLSAVAFAAAVPFARVPLIKVPAFIPAYEAALVINDLITATLFFGQFSQVRSRSLLALASGYLFDAFMVIPHAASFPGLFSPTGLLGANGQTTAWLYMFWHAGFPLFLMAYVGYKRQETREPGAERSQVGIPSAIITVLGTVGALTLLAAAGHAALPEIMAGNGYTPAMKFVVASVWTLSLAALLLLWWSRSPSVLDLWLMVVMCAWLFDIALSAVLNAGRFDLGFYAGRAYGLMAASFVLAMLLIEPSGIHSRLAAAPAPLERPARGGEVRVRARTEEQVAANRELRAVIEATPVAIYMLDPDGVVILWEASAERIFGYTEQEALGKTPSDLIEGPQADFRADLACAAKDPSASGSLETRRRRKDGETIDVLTRWARVNDETGRMLGITCTAADITERKKLEGQLQQSQKMEAVGNLTAGMAHDFNNLLGIIIGNLDLLRDQPNRDPEVDELAHEALDAALRGADLTRRLLAFARRQPLQPERIDVNQLIGQLSNLLKRTLGEEVEITLELDAKIWPIVADPAQLEASLTNLATNARDAMPKGGHLTIATHNQHLDEDYASQYPEVQAGDYATIEVGDTGTGMPPEVASRIFEPFYTTKEPGKGTGLGLSMIFGFMKQSGGHINVYSEVGIGTIFRLYLPRAEIGEAVAEDSMPQPVVRGNGETVLAVEDNAGLRRVVVRQLGELGYRVIEAEDPQAALEILKDTAVDLLFTDIVMPGGTSGYELARMVQSRWPTVKVVLTSGFPQNKINSDGEHRNFRLLSKPYRREDLGRAIREAFDV